jgi:hypothetical protein
MKRRTFFALVWVSLAVVFGLLAVQPIFDDGAVDLGYGLVTVAHGSIAGVYWMHPQPIDDPDEPAPREWFELAGLIAMALLGSTLLLFVVVG